MGELFFILFEVAELCGAHALPTCLCVSLTYLSCIPDTLHRCFADLNDLGAGDPWYPRSDRSELALLSPCTPSSSTPARVLG